MIKCPIWARGKRVRENRVFLLCVSWWKLYFFKVKCVVCVQFNRILRKLRTSSLSTAYRLTPSPAYCVPKWGVTLTIRSRYIQRFKPTLFRIKYTDNLHIFSVRSSFKIHRGLKLICCVLHGITSHKTFKIM